MAKGSSSSSRGSSSSSRSSSSSSRSSSSSSRSSSSSSSSRSSSSSSSSKGSSSSWISVSRNSNGSYTVSSWWRSTTVSASSSLGRAAAAAYSSGNYSSGSSSSWKSSSWSSSSGSSSSGSSGGSYTSSSSWGSNTKTSSTPTTTTTKTSSSTPSSSTWSSASANIGWVNYSFSKNSNWTINITANWKTSTVSADSAAWKAAASYLWGTSSSTSSSSSGSTTKSTNTSTNTTNQATTSKSSQNWNTITYQNWMKLTKNSNWSFTVTDVNWNTSTVSAVSTAWKEFAKQFWSSTSSSGSNSSTNTTSNSNQQTSNMTWNRNWNTVTYPNWTRLIQNSNGSFTVIDANWNTSTVAANSAAGKTFAQQFAGMKASNVANTISSDNGSFKMNPDGNTWSYTTPGWEKFTVQLTADGKYVAIDSKWVRHQFVSKNALIKSLSWVEANRNAANNDNFNSLTNNNNNNNNVNNTQKNKEDAFKTILNNQDLTTNKLETKTKTLSDWRQLQTDDEWNETYIAPNGKEYPIYYDANGKPYIESKVDGSKKAFTSLDRLLNHIDVNNQDDWIDRSNRGTQDVPNGEIEWTYRAPSGKEYDMIQGTGARQGQYWFINNKGEVAWYNSYDEAKSVIDANNPVWSTDLAKNEPLKTREDTNYFDEDNGLAMTGEESIDAMNEQNEKWEDERDTEIEDLRQQIEDLNNRLENDSDETYNKKQQIVNTMLWDLDTFTNDINNAIDDLKEKSKLIQDNDRMRRARARARELAAKWYLTSEQVQQVANYSLADYNAELEANALQAAKAIADIQVQIAQKKQDYLAVVRSQQWNNENDRLAQENLINERFNSMLQYIDGIKSQADQFYQGNIQNNLAMNAQNELWVNSLIKQNDAQNIVDDRNQQRAFTDSTYRRQYILEHIWDTNLYSYADRLINDLIKNGKFVFYNKTNEQNKQLLAEQISKISEGAKLLQQQDTLAANK